MTLLLRRFGAFLISVLAAAIVGAVVQTQFNLAALTRLDVAVSLNQRVAMTGADIVHFAPVFALLLAAVFLPAFLAAGWIVRRHPARRTALFILAGGTAVLGALVTMNALMPLTPIQMTRDALGLLALSTTGLIGGWVFAVVLRFPGLPR